MKKYFGLILTILVIILFILGVLFINYYRTEINVPLGEFMIYLSIIILCSALLYCSMVEYIKNFKTKKKKKRDKKKYFALIFSTILWILIICLFAEKCIDSATDLYNGTSQIILYDTKIIETKVRGYRGYNTKYFINGKSLDNKNIKIDVSYRQKDNFIDLIEEGNIYKITYFKKMNLVYDAELIGQNERIK